MKFVRSVAVRATAGLSIFPIWRVIVAVVVTVTERICGKIVPPPGMNTRPIVAVVVIVRAMIFPTDRVIAGTVPTVALNTCGMDRIMVAVVVTVTD